MVDVLCMMTVRKELSQHVIIKITEVHSTPELKSFPEISAVVKLPTIEEMPKLPITFPLLCLSNHLPNKAMQPGHTVDCTSPCKHQQNTYNIGIYILFTPKRTIIQYINDDSIKPPDII